MLMRKPGRRWTSQDRLADGRAESAWETLAFLVLFPDVAIIAKECVEKFGDLKKAESINGDHIRLLDGRTFEVAAMLFELRFEAREERERIGRRPGERAGRDASARSPRAAAPHPGGADPAAVRAGGQPGRHRAA